MAKPLKPGSTKVEIRPSRIRRDPVPAKEAEAEKKLQWGRSDEREIWLGILGIVVFALAIDVIMVGISTYWT
jgi:hypothetical protein